MSWTIFLSCQAMWLSEKVADRWHEKASQVKQTKSQTLLGPLMIVSVRRQARSEPLSAIASESSESIDSSCSIIFIVSLAWWMNVLDESVKTEGWKDDLNIANVKVEIVASDGWQGFSASSRFLHLQTPQSRILNRTTSHKFPLKMMRNHYFAAVLAVHLCAKWKR